MTIKNYAEAAAEIAQKAGDLLLKEFGGEREITHKGKIDLVTEMDKKSEDLILDYINKNFPDDNVLSEEDGASGTGGGNRWIVDPLDGTTNYAHGFPFFATSIAVESRDKEIIAAAVCAPYMNELYTASLGGGAFLNGKEIRVSDIEKLSLSVLATGFPYDVDEGAKNLEYFGRFLYKTQAVRRPGSAALDLCAVAAGRFDGFWEFGLKPWDTAAGMLLVREAGGLVTRIDGSDYNPFMQGVLAANPFIHAEMIEVLKDE
ncbi:MAG: inositol monophosphatase [Elusimicrobia bacterium]|nr:inositol monophosphatase [Elusimicrobiota bacterium]